MPRPYHLEVARRHLQLRQPDAPVRQPLFQFCFAFVSADGWNIVRARLIVGHRTHAAPCRLPEVFGSANVAAVFRSCWVSFCHRHFIRPLPWALTPRSRRTLRMRLRRHARAPHLAVRTHDFRAFASRSYNTTFTHAARFMQPVVGTKILSRHLSVIALPSVPSSGPNM